MFALLCGLMGGIVVCVCVFMCVCVYREHILHTTHSVAVYRVGECCYGY